MQEGKKIKRIKISYYIFESFSGIKKYMQQKDI